MSKNRDTEDYLKERIIASGFPLEIEISNILESKAFLLFNSNYYFDEEIQKGREIDIYAFPTNEEKWSKKLRPFAFNPYLAIECKKSESHAWIFYTRPRLSGGMFVNGHYASSVPSIDEFSTDSFEWCFEEETLKFHYDKFRLSAIAYDEIKKTKTTGSTEKSRKEIFEATNQLVKYVRYESSEATKRYMRLHEKFGREYIQLAFPIIVFDGDMYEATFYSGQLKLQKTNHILLSTHFRCPYSQEVKNFTIDVVNKAQFPTFVDLMTKDIMDCSEAIYLNKDELLKRAERNRSLHSAQ
jgi:hypothetical protein